MTSASASSPKTTFSSTFFEPPPGTNQPQWPAGKSQENGLSRPCVPLIAPGYTLLDFRHPAEIDPRFAICGCSSLNDRIADPTGRTKNVKTLLICLIAAAVLAPTASAARMTPVQAAAKLKATYTTVDPKAYTAVKEHIVQELAGGRLPTDPVVVELQGDLHATLHAAKVTTARCTGVGKKAGRYSKFHCTARLLGTERTPPDRLFYTATVKLTVNVAHGFGVKPGWR